MTDDHERYSDNELKAEFAALFPQGWAGPDVLAEIAPQGWDKSPWVVLDHPTPELIHEESVRIQRNLAMLGRKPDAPPPAPEPTLEEITAEYQPSPLVPERECREMVGRCLWDIFSDNHTVCGPDGRQLDLGSARGSGGFLADILNSQPGPPPAPKPEMPADLMEKMFPPYTGDDPTMLAFIADMKKEMFGDGGYVYLDFYMGSGTISHRVNLQPVYQMIFRRMLKRDLDWEYSFPRLHLVDFRPLKKKLDEEKRKESGESEWESYDPAAAFEQEQADAEKDKEIAEMREELDEGHREAVEAALQEHPPAIVQAYEVIYGDYPTGWPPEAE
jgi:hypothetical protein